MSSILPFDDLRQEPTEIVEERYNTLLTQVEALDRERKEAIELRKAHSSVIKYAVNKQERPTLAKDLPEAPSLVRAMELKSAFDALLNERDEFVSRISVRKDRIEQMLDHLYNALVLEGGRTNVTVDQEREMFSRFFEAQAMLDAYRSYDVLLHELNATRRMLLEEVKSINRDDRRWSQTVARQLTELRSLRREAGRLKTFLEQSNRTGRTTLPDLPEDLSTRLYSGDSISLEELSLMLAHGGLSALPEPKNVAFEPQRRRTPQHQSRRSSPRRGRAQHERNGSS